MMEQTAVLSLAVLALGATVQAAALLAIAWSAWRVRRTLARTGATVAPTLAATAGHGLRTLQNTDAAIEQAAVQLRRTSSAAERLRADAAKATDRASGALDALVAVAWTLGPVAESVERGFEAYRAARGPSASPWHAAVDRGLARYRSEKLRQPVVGREPVR
jgi:hypothetical protein